MKHIAVNIKQYLPFGSVVWMGRTAFVEEKKDVKSNLYNKKKYATL